MQEQLTELVQVKRENELLRLQIEQLRENDAIDAKVMRQMEADMEALLKGEIVEYEAASYYTPGAGPLSFLLFLNKMGKEGWKLCFTQDLSHNRLCIFQRTRYISSTKEKT